MSGKDHIYIWPGTEQLIPSVTTVIKDILREPKLEDWRVVQAVMLARQHREADFDRIKELVNADRNYYGQIGTDVHAVVKAFHNGTEFPEGYNRTEVAPLADAYIMWAQASYVGGPLHCEEVAYAELGGLRYGGRPDIPLVTLRAGTYVGTAKLTVDTTALIDVKTGSNTRDEWQLQLAGYQMMGYQWWGLDPEALLTVRIDRHGGVHAKAWDPATNEFMSMLNLWYWRYGEPELEKRMADPDE